MEELNNEELKKIDGGFIGINGITLIALGVPFAIGVLEGFFTPISK